MQITNLIKQDNHIFKLQLFLIYMRRNLIDYFKKNLKKGYTSDSLKYALFNQGYPRVEVNNALEKANQELAREAPRLKEKPDIKYELRDEDDRLIEVKKPWWKRLFGF